MTHFLNAIISGTPKTPTLDKPVIIIAQTLLEKHIPRSFKESAYCARHMVTLQ